MKRNPTKNLCYQNEHQNFAFLHKKWYNIVVTIS